MGLKTCTGRPISMGCAICRERNGLGLRGAGGGAADALLPPSLLLPRSARGVCTSSVLLS